RTSSAVSRLEALSGFQSKATRERAGTAALNSCSRLGCTSGPRMVLPVMLPPGWARPCTSPVHTTSPTAIITMGIVVVAALAAMLGAVPKVAIPSTGRRARSVAASASRSGAPIGTAIFKRNVLAFQIAEIAQSLPESIPHRRIIDDADARNPSLLLRARRER